MRSDESVNKKIRNAQLMQYNYMLTVGDKEMENRTIALRTRDNVVHGENDIRDIPRCDSKKNDRESIGISILN